MADAQFTANSLAELRSYGLSTNNSTVSLSTTGGDPHPVTGVVTPGQYWINGDHIANPTNSHPIFMELGGTGNTYNLSGATINVDTRKLDGFGRNLGHDSGVDILRISGSGNTIQGINLIGQDIALDTDPNAQRYADWSTVYVEMSGANNMVDGANVVTRGSRTDSYGLGDAFGKGASQGITPFLAHRKASAFRVGEATNAIVNDMHLDVNTFGHGFFVQASTDTTLTNSTVTGELFPSQGVIDHPLYQQHGVTYHQNPIPDDLWISGAEGGVRMYTGSSGITVDNVVVTNMRSGFSTSLGGGTKTLNNVEAYGTENGFGFGSNTTITNAKADGINGPILGVDRNIRRNSSVEIELVGDQPFNHDYALAYVNGDEIDITITSDRPAEDFENTTLIRTAQFYYDNWRETNDTTTFDVPGYDHINSVLINDTNTLLVLGEQASGNVGRSLGGVVSSGKENHYDGVTVVPNGTRLEVVHVKGLGNSGTETGAEFDNNFNVVLTGTATDATLDDNASVVMGGGTLELQPGIAIVDEKLTISGNGVDGQGALYTDGASNNSTRFGSSSNSDESTIVLDGNSSIGVGVAGNQLLVGRIQGTGNLTKLGPGTLSIEKSATFDGNLIISQGHVIARSGVVNHDLSVASGASIVGIGNNAINTSGLVIVDGLMDINGRNDEGTLIGRIGALSGNGVITASNPNSINANQLTIGANDSVGFYTGQIQSNLNVVKTGSNLQILFGNNTYTGTTIIDGGKLAVNGIHNGGGAYSVQNGGILTGSGNINASVVVEAGGILAPGFDRGELTIEDVQLQANATLEIELAAASHDVLTVDSIVLGGDLSVSFSGSLAPYAADEFTIVSADSLSGAFANVASGSRVGTAGGEGSFQVEYNAALDEVILANFLPAGLLGDFDSNGVVDAADFTIWQDELGSTDLIPFSGADASGDGIVDSADYTVWRNNFGQTSPLPVVPEPEGLIFPALLSFLWIARRRK